MSRCPVEQEDGVGNRVFCSGEEGGGGKILLWEKGAYEGLDVCLMYVLSPPTFISDVERA